MQGEWEDIFAGRIDLSALHKVWLRLLQQMHDLKAKYLPTGLPRRNDLFRLAEQDAASHFRAVHGMES